MNKFTRVKHTFIQGDCKKMKRIFSLLMAVIIVTMVLVFNTRPASAAPLGLIVHADAFKKMDAGAKVPAQFWADSNWHSVYCVTVDEAGDVSCQFPEKYAGKSVTLKLNDSLIFYVTVPVRHVKKNLTWTFVANENETFNIPAGTYQVQYGADDFYNAQTFTGPTTVSCDNATFGDPIYGMVKACYILQ